MTNIIDAFLVKKAADSLCKAFNWSQSPQGGDYWCIAYCNLLHMTGYFYISQNRIGLPTTTDIQKCKKVIYTMNNGFLWNESEEGEVYWQQVESFLWQIVRKEEMLIYKDDSFEAYDRAMKGV